MAATVFEIKNGFYKVLVENKYKWLRKEDGENYWGFDRLVKDRAGGVLLSETWDGNVFAMPNKSPKKLPPLAPNEQGTTNRKVEYLDSKIVDDVLWFKFRILGRPCVETPEDKKVHAEGWVRAFSSVTGRENAWIMSHGC